MEWKKYLLFKVINIYGTSFLYVGGRESLAEKVQKSQFWDRPQSCYTFEGKQTKTISGRNWNIKCKNKRKVVEGNQVILQKKLWEEKYISFN